MSKAPITPTEPSMLDPCTCRRDGAPCQVCKTRDKHIAWFEARPWPELKTQDKERKA